MKINKERLSFYSAKMLKFIGDNNITSFSDFERRLGNTYDLEKEITLEISLRPSLLTEVMTLACKDNRAGTPIEVRMHSDLGYLHCVVKCYETICGYRHFASDSFGNMAQVKIIPDYNYSLLVKELQDLSDKKI